MRNRFCLNAATIKKAPLEQQIQLASQAGFSGIGLWLDDIEAAIGRGVPLDGIARLLEQAHLKVEELCFLGGWQEADENVFPAVLERAHRICCASQALGCDIVVVVPAIAAGLLAGASARLREICGVAAQYEVRLALEFPGTAAEVKDLRTAWQLVSGAACENAGMAVDSFHFHLGGSRIDDLAAVPAGKIFLIHLSDAMDVPTEQLGVHHDNRTYPGEGTLDYRPLLTALDEKNYQGAYSLEIWNQRLREGDPAEVVRRGYASLLRLEGLANSLKAAKQPSFSETPGP